MQKDYLSSRAGSSAPLGHAAVARHLRSVLFSEPILGAASVRPKGLLKATVLSVLLGWAGPMLTRRATAPLPPTLIYIAVTPVDIRLFSKPGLADAFEIGRWKKGSYRAAVTTSSRSLHLDLELERLGRVRLSGARSVRDVFDLVVAGAVGPAV